MSNEDWTTLQHYARHAWDEYQSEIGGYMVVKYINNQFVFTEPVILEQEITAGNTDITKEAMGKYFTETEIKHGKEPYWLCWWHSHHTMGVFWSATDTTAIEQDQHTDYDFSLVINLKEEQILRISDWKTGTQVDTVVEIESKTVEMPKYISDNVAELCTKPSSVIKTSVGWGSNWDTSRKITKNQVQLWADKEDEEKVQLEAEIDDILQDYTMDDDYSMCRKRLGNLNRKLGAKKSELRVGVLDKVMLDSVINIVLADSYIYSKGTNFDINTMVEQTTWEGSFK
jgi:hypothetical protein